MDTMEWRTQLKPDSRERMVNDIMEMLKKHLPFSGPEGMKELRKIAARFEDKIFTGAVDQTDYLRKISMKMLAMETKSQNEAGSSSSVPAANNNGLPLDPCHHHMDNTVDSKPFLPKAEPVVKTGDWRTHLPLDFSQKNDANKISIQYVMEPSLPSGEPENDWRTRLPPDSREKVVNKIRETLRKHLPFSGPEGIKKLRKIAARFEEKMLRGAINQTDYLRKISTKMLIIETKYQNAAGSSSSSSSTFTAASNSRPLNPEPAVNTGDWRAHLPPDSRKKNANKIMGTLKKHVPNCGQQGSKDLKRIAASFEKLIFNTAIDQVDYFRKISFKMQTMENGD